MNNNTIIPDYHVILTEIVPYAIDLLTNKSPSKYKHKPIKDLVIALHHDGSLYCLEDLGGFCKFKINGVVKTFRYAKSFSNEWKVQPEQDCCGYPRMNDNDIPINWKEKIVLRRTMK